MRTRSIVWIILTAVLHVGFAIGQIQPSGARGLPLPTGPFAIGRISLLVEDGSRIEPLDPRLGERRIMADVWYPAARESSVNHVPALYLDAQAIERAIGAEGLKNQLRQAYDAVLGGVVTHAQIGAPFAPTLRLAPVLIFSPGGGMIRELYTVQFEELASQGYIVVAINHTYDAFVTLFPDGSHVAYDSKRWPRVPSVEGEASLNQLEWHTDDVGAVLDMLAKVATTTTVPFAGRMDLAHVGAFGHSFGGIVAARACQKDPRIKACLNQDGAVAKAPYFVDSRGWGMDQAFMLIERSVSTKTPTDQELAAMKMTRAKLVAIGKRLDARRDRALRATGKGAVWIALRAEGTSHDDFSDLPLLGARDAGEYALRAQFLSVVNRYTRAFFDLHLRGLESPLFRTGKLDLVDTIQEFAPSTTGK